MSDPEETIPDETVDEPRPLRVRARVVALAILLGAPAISGLSFLIPEDRPAPVDRSFNGDGPINVTEDGVAIKGYDVVAYFLRERPIKGSPAIAATYGDATFRFASEENRQRFLENPEAYLPAYGGYCSLGVSNGYKDDMHPEAFEIVDGRLYFNLTPRIGRAWSREKDRYIARADENWPELLDAPGYGWGDAR